MLIPYTICFCFCNEHVLMLYRSKQPNANRWNGLGGKIEAGETPLESIQREMLEEAAIDVQKVQELRYTGLVTWANGKDPTLISGGMHAFLAFCPAAFATWPDRPTPEGLLSWKPFDWVCDSGNTEVVSNISHFLPHMLDISYPQTYHCHYRKHVLRSMSMYPLSLGYEVTSGQAHTPREA